MLGQLALVLRGIVRLQVGEEAQWSGRGSAGLWRESFLANKAS